MRSPSIEAGVVLSRLARGRLRALLWRRRGARLGPKCQVGPRCRLDRPWCLHAGPRVAFEDSVFVKIVADSARVEIGELAFLGRGVELDVRVEIRIGAHSLLAPGCFVTDHEHRMAAGLTIDSQGCEEGPVAIGSDVWLGAGAIVLPGVRIGDGAVVGAGAVVTRDVPAQTVVAGVPARVLRRR